VWAVEGYEIGKEVSVGKASVSYAEPGEDDFKVTGRLVGGAPGTGGIFKLGQDVMGLVFPV